MPKKSKITSKLSVIPEIETKEKDIAKVLQTLKEENAEDEKKIKLSFRFFDRNNSLFNLGEVENEWFIDLLDSMKLLTKITRKQLFGEYKEKFKPHPYNEIKKLNWKDEMLTNPQYEAWQLRINKSKGRFHGFFVENIYYIKFLDRWHNMYDDKKYGGIEYKEYPITSYEKLEAELKNKSELVEKYKFKSSRLEKTLTDGFSAICDNCSDCEKVDKVYKNFEL